MVEIIHSTMRSTKNAKLQLQATIMDSLTVVCQYKGIRVKSVRMQLTSGAAKSNMIYRLYMTLKSCVTIAAIIATLLTSGTAAALVVAGDIDCELNQFLNHDGKCILNRECAEIDDFVTERCQPMDRSERVG